MKVLLVQLPVPNNRISNLPLALGYLKAMADAAHLPGVQVEILEREAQDRGGDAYLLDVILAHDPDMVGFSLYTWNSTRSLALARGLKQRAPEIFLLGGGPEVNRDGDFILAETAFDFLVFGEGERTFAELLRHFSEGAPDLPRIAGLGYRPSGSPGLRINPPRVAIEDVNLVPSAYLNGTLDRYLDRFISIELSRWCPSKCSFCYYGRQDLPFGGKRYFDLGRIRAELDYAMARGVEQVHFVEANFNTLPHLDQIYRTIRESGANRKLRFYAEMRGEAIDAAEADKLVECNFGTVEVGLQSAVPEVLAKVRRKNHLPRLVQGVHNLRERGVEVFLDAILGLPGETPETFHRTLDFIEQHELQPYDLFHLQLLSGTQLKAEALAGMHGMRWQPAPPYFVLETAELSFSQLCQLRKETLERKGDDPTEIAGLPEPGPFALSLPDNTASSTPGTGPLERLILDLDNLPDLAPLARCLASEVTLWLRGDNLEMAAKVLKTLSAPNPSGVWHVFLDTARPLTEAKLTALSRAIYHTTGYLDRLAVFALEQKDPENFPVPPSVNLFNVVPWQPGKREEGNSQTVWRVDLKRENPAEQWRAALEEAASAPAGGLYLVSDPSTPLEKLLTALQGFESGSKRLWFSDIALASGLAGEETPLDYPLTWQSGSTHKLDSATLTRATLRYELAKRRLG